LEIIELIFLANPKPDKSKLLILNKIDIKLKIIQTFVRIFFDVQIINQAEYIQLQESLQEIGRMLGGWIRDIKDPKKETPAD